MINRLFYLFMSILMLSALVQCEESITISGGPDLIEPNLIAPEDSTLQSTSLSFDWEAIEDAENYRIQIGTDENFSSTIIDSLTQNTDFDISGLPYDTTIYWQVRAMIAEVEGPWSQTWQFSTEEEPQNADPVSTELQSPEDNATDQEVDVSLQWTMVASASAYNVQVATDESFDSILTDQEVQNSSYQTSNLNFDQTYYWRVEPVVSDQETEWSSVFSFSTMTETQQVPAVTLVAPSDGATDQSTTLSLEWEELSDINEYRVQVGTDNNFSSPLVDQTTANLSYEVSDLEYSQTYYWRVQASGDNNSENWSNVREFTTEEETTNSTNNAIVSAESGDFVVDGQPFQVVGTNAYHLPNYEKINPSTVNTTFDAFQDAGVNLVRMWGFYDGPPQYDGDITLQPEPGVYDEENLQHLDEVIAKGKEHGVRFVVTLVNYWSQLGGVPQYNEWDGNSGGGMSHFINDPDTQQWFRDYISMLLNRVNTVTGVAYKNEPAIFSWEIINEGRLSGGDPAELRDWYQDIAQHIKSIDSNHMVSTGEEGFDDSSLGSWTDGGSFQHPDYSTDSYSNTYVLRANEGTSYVLNTQIPEIDYGTAHWYPSEWGWGTTVDQDMFDAQHAWISDHIAIAEAEGKPFLLGEYGFPGWGDARVEQVYNDLWSYAEQTELDGSLLWQFTPTGTKCYEYGGNICWPGGRQDEVLYNSFRDHIQTINSSN